MWGFLIFLEAARAAAALERQAVAQEAVAGMLAALAERECLERHPEAPTGAFVESFVEPRHAPRRSTIIEGEWRNVTPRAPSAPRLIVSPADRPVLWHC